MTVLTFRRAATWLTPDTANPDSGLTDLSIGTDPTETATPPVVIAGPAQALVTRYRYDRPAPGRGVHPRRGGGGRQHPQPGGHPTVNTFSADNLIESTLAPLAGDGSLFRLTTYGYDPSARKISQSTGEVDRGRGPGGAHHQPGSWHPNDRPATRTGRGGEVVTTAYDPAGNVATVTDSTNPAAALGGDFCLDGAPRTVTDGAGASPARPPTHNERLGVST